jgi:hypothetical protein
MSLTINPGTSINPGITLSGGWVPPIVLTNLLFNLDMKNYVSGQTWPDASVNHHQFTFGVTPTVVNQGTNQAYWDNSSNTTVANPNDGTILPVGSYTKGAMIWTDGNVGGSNILSSSTGNDAFWTAATVYLNSGHNGQWSTVVSETPIVTSPPSWVYVAVTFDTTSGWVLYQNGEVVGTNADTTTFIGDSAPQIGGFENSNNFTGKISAAHVYTRALTQNEIRQNYIHLRHRYNATTA